MSHTEFDPPSAKKTSSKRRSSSDQRSPSDQRSEKEKDKVKASSRERVKAKQKKSQLTSVADVLQAVLTNGQSKIGDGFLCWRLEREWLQVVGESMAAETRPLSIKDGVLTVWVRHSAWMQQLWFFRETMAQRVNQYLGVQHIQRVHLTLRCE